MPELLGHFGRALHEPPHVDERRGAREQTLGVALEAARRGRFGGQRLVRGSKYIFSQSHNDGNRRYLQQPRVHVHVRKPGITTQGAVASTTSALAAQMA